MFVCHLVHPNFCLSCSINDSIIVAICYIGTFRKGCEFPVMISFIKQTFPVKPYIRARGRMLFTTVRSLSHSKWDGELRPAMELNGQCVQIDTSIDKGSAHKHIRTHWTSNIEHLVQLMKFRRVGNSMWVINDNG